MSTIPAALMNRINADNLKHFMRSIGESYSSRKEELFVKLGEIIENESIKVLAEKYIADEIKHGDNRMIFVSEYTISDFDKMKDLEYCKKKLANANLPNENFNKILEYTGKDIEDGYEELVYLQILTDKENPDKVEQIDLCFAENMKKDNDSPSTVEYFWMTVYLDKLHVHFKTKSFSNAGFRANDHEKKLYGKYIDIFERIFQIYRKKIILEKKNLLYRMFIYLITEAEKPFTEKIAPYEEKFEEFNQMMLKELNIKDPNLYRYAFVRFKRLYERTLIQDNFLEYEGYSENKLGSISKMVFSDETGAKVIARANADSSFDKKIQLSDIYFDVRETINDIKQFDTLWVEWFLAPLGSSGIINTKIDVSEKYYLVHILNKHYTKEEENLVFSNIEQSTRI